MDRFILLCTLFVLALADRPPLSKTGTTKGAHIARAGALQPTSRDSEKAAWLAEEDAAKADGAAAMPKPVLAEAVEPAVASSPKEGGEEAHKASENDALMQVWGASDDTNSESEQDEEEPDALDEYSDSSLDDSEETEDDEESPDTPPMAGESLVDTGPKKKKKTDNKKPKGKSKNQKGGKGKDGKGKGGKGKGGKGKGGKGKGGKGKGKAKKEPDDAIVSEADKALDHELCQDLCIQCPSGGPQDGVTPPTWYGGRNISVIRHWFSMEGTDSKENACFIDRLVFGSATNKPVELSVQALAWFIKQPVFPGTVELPSSQSFVHDPWEYPSIADYNLIGWWKLATADTRVLEKTRVNKVTNQSVNQHVDVRYEIRYVPIVSYLEDMVAHQAAGRDSKSVSTYTKVAYELRMHVQKDYTCKAVFWAKEKVNFAWSNRFASSYGEKDGKNGQRLAFKAKLLCARNPAGEDAAQGAPVTGSGSGDQKLETEENSNNEDSVKQDSMQSQVQDNDLQDQSFIELEQGDESPGKAGHILGLDESPTNQIPQVRVLKEKRYGYNSDVRMATKDCYISVYMHSFTRLALKFDGSGDGGGGCEYAHPGESDKNKDWTEEAIRDAKSTSDGEELYFEEQRDQAMHDSMKEREVLKEHLGYSFERAIVEANEYASAHIHDDAIARLTMHPLFCNNLVPATVTPANPGDDSCLANQLETNKWNLWPKQNHFMNKYGAVETPV